MKKEKRFPTIVGIILLLAATLAGIFLTSRKTSFFSKASGDCLPTNIQVTNITHKSANISFITTAACMASVAVSNQNIDDLRYPDKGSKTHYFSASNLTANTEYNFVIISGGQTYSDSNSFKTASTPTSQTPTAELAWGKVYIAAQQPAANAIIFLNIPGAAPLSAIVTSSGNWTTPLSTCFNESKTSWFVLPSEPVSEEITVVSEDGRFTQATNLSTNNNPVPNIIIGQSETNLSSPTPVTSNGLGASRSQSSSIIELSISNPKEGEVVDTAFPDFFGNAPINTPLEIQLQSGSFRVNGTSQSNSSGVWHWSPTTGLSRGSYSLVLGVTSTSQTITRNFVLSTNLGAGPAFTASASATLAPPTSTPAIEPTATATTLPTHTPTDIVRVAHPSTSSAPPVSGSSFPTIIVTTFGLLFVIFSFII